MKNQYKTRFKRIAILGAGVVGLTCALRLSENNNVEILAEKFGVESDSWKATAIWHVYLVPETEQVLEWAEQSLGVFYNLAQTQPESGVELVKGVELFRSGHPRIPKWAYIPRLFRMLTDEEINSFNNFNVDGLPSDYILKLRDAPVRWGYEIEAPVANMKEYLIWLENKVRNAGVKFTRIHINRLEQISSKYDLIVNCSGFGARKLLDDYSFVAYKGQYFVLRGDTLSPREYIGDDDHPGGMAYMIPRRGELMIGGAAEEGVEDEELTLDWEETKIRAGLYVPWLRATSFHEHARPPVVCIRPAREGGIRLELDLNITSVPVVHNYGHGGSGFSLSWGCADSVEQIINNIEV